MAFVSDANTPRLKTRTLALLFLCGIFSFQSLAAVNNDSLPTVSAPTIRISEVVDQKRIEYIISQLQQQLSLIGANSGIVRCDHVMELTEQIGGHDYSYGASCIISNGNHQRSVLLCNDNLVGKFTLGGSDSRTAEGVGRFIKNNCPPGG